MLAAWEFTIWATQRITMSLIVGDLPDGEAGYDQDVCPGRFWSGDGFYQGAPPVLFHDVLKGPEEVLLEAEVSQLSFLQELHGELPQ